MLRGWGLGFCVGFTDSFRLEASRNKGIRIQKVDVKNMDNHLLFAVPKNPEP